MCTAIRYAPPRRLLRHIDGMTERVRQYDELPFEDWLPLHQQIERELKEGSYFIPLYNEERTIPFLSLIHISEPTRRS